MQTEIEKDILELKGSIKKPISMSTLFLSGEEARRIAENIEEINDRLEKIERYIIETKIRQETPLSTKRQDNIILFLRKNEYTAGQLATVLGISRNRCNEYLRELEKQGKVRGNLVGKKKFYYAVEEDNSKTNSKEH